MLVFASMSASLWRAIPSLSMMAACALSACGGGNDGADAGRSQDAGSREHAQAASSSSTVTLVAHGSFAQGVGPIAEVRVNGNVVTSQEIRSATFQSYSYTVPKIPPGAAVDVVYTNNLLTSTEDRNLYLQSITIDGTTYLPSQPGMRYDRGYGAAAFDGVDVIPGQTDMKWSGALRFTLAAAAAPTPTQPAPGGPVILNAPASARPGDIVGLQGENFGTAPVVWLNAAGSAPAVRLPVMNKVDTGFVAVQIPTGATSALSLRVVNGSVSSPAVKLNAARPYHLDALQIVPGTRFRIFGRNLRLNGFTPVVTVNGQRAVVDVAASDEHMVIATAPSGLGSSAGAVITVDNGNGTGPATLDRTIDVALTGSGDPFSLGVGWTAGFSGAASRVVQAASDSRLKTKVACNGSTNDSPAIQSAIDLAATNGGGIVQLPAGTCRLAGGFGLRSNVVVQGAGKSSTVLRYEQDYPFWGANLDFSGVRNLTLSNTGGASNGPSLVDSTRVVLQNVRIEMGTSHQVFLTNNRNIVISGCDFIQGGSINQQGPFVISGSSGLVFVGNSVILVNGATSFGQVHDAYVQGNHFSRDGRNQWTTGIVHMLTLDFAYRVALIGNTFDVISGPITNKTRNDGETLVTEGGGADRTENLGNVSTASATTLSDPGNSIRTDPFGKGRIVENYGVAIVAGKGAGQTRRLTAYNGGTMTVDQQWDVTPDNTSRYATFVWGLEKSLIKGNTLSQNPRGIWLYQTAIREVDVVGNMINEGGGIYLRSYQSLSDKMFDPIYNVRIQGNRISNTTRNWLSHINTVFVNHDAKAFGIGFIGIQVRDNQIIANQPNLSLLQTEDYASTEGYMDIMRVENYSLYQPLDKPRLLGTIYQRNGCTNCDVAFRLGTGAGGTVISGSQLTNSKSLTTNTATTISKELAIDTFIQ